MRSMASGAAFHRAYASNRVSCLLLGSKCKCDTRGIAFGTSRVDEQEFYRDLAQHFVVLASNARIVTTNSQFEAFFLPLPRMGACADL
jgi:hypothetical protein